MDGADRNDDSVGGVSADRCPAAEAGRDICLAEAGLDNEGVGCWIGRGHDFQDFAGNRAEVRSCIEPHLDLITDGDAADVVLTNAEPHLLTFEALDPDEGTAGGREVADLNQGLDDPGGKGRAHRRLISH